MKKTLAVVLAVLMALSLMVACKSTATNEETQATKDDVKIVLISNQRSGDLGPVDAMFAGAKRVEQDFGVTVKTLESADAAAYEEDIRAMAKEGYNLILTTFPPMTEATKAVAADYPDIMFGAIFQYINVDDASVANIWDTEYRGEECTYVLGTIAATLTQSNKIGYVSGDEASSVCEACNGFMRGALAANPDVTVKFMSVGSYEDPAKAKEIANAMIAEGVDVIQTDAGNSQVGVIEAAKEAGIFVSGDVSDNTELYSNGFFAYLGIDFGENVYLACKQFIEGNFPGGQHGYMNIASGTYFVDFDLLETLKTAQPDKSDKIQEAITAGQDVYSKIKSGEITVEYDITAPSWDRIKTEG